MDYCTKSFLIFSLCLGLSYLAFHAFVLFALPLFAQSEVVAIDALVSGCGDLLIDIGEECDSSNLGGQTCTTRGFGGGSLSCTASCIFNTTSCTVSGGGGGSSGSGNKATVVLVGKAYPGSLVTILKDGKAVAKTIASPLANFQVSVSGLSAGEYTFSLFTEDSKKIRSATLSLPVMVSRGIVTKIEDLFIAPTIGVDKSEVKKGDTIVIFGQSVPKAKVTLEVNSPNQFFLETLASVAGIYLYNFNTAVLELGSHTSQTKAATTTEISPDSLVVPFVVGNTNVFSQQGSVCPPKADFNADCKVNLVDFSIAAFWYNRTLSEEFALREKEKVNGDGKINLVDFSIMAFYWTG